MFLYTLYYRKKREKSVFERNKADIRENSVQFLTPIKIIIAVNSRLREKVAANI